MLCSVCYESEQGTGPQASCYCAFPVALLLLLAPQSRQESFLIGSKLQIAVSYTFSLDYIRTCHTHQCSLLLIHPAYTLRVKSKIHSRQDSPESSRNEKRCAVLQLMTLWARSRELVRILTRNNFPTRMQLQSTVVAHRYSSDSIVVINMRVSLKYCLFPHHGGRQHQDSYSAERTSSP